MSRKFSRRPHFLHEAFERKSLEQVPLLRLCENHQGKWFIGSECVITFISHGNLRLRPSISQTPSIHELEESFIALFTFSGSGKRGGKPVCKKVGWHEVEEEGSQVWERGRMGMPSCNTRKMEMEFGKFTHSSSVMPIAI